MVHHHQNACAAALKDVVIQCMHSHFTLLRPCGSGYDGFAVLDRLLQDARAAGMVVQECSVDGDDDVSIACTVHRILGDA